MKSLLLMLFVLSSHGTIQAHEVASLQEAYDTGYKDGYKEGLQKGYQNAKQTLLKEVNSLRYQVEELKKLDRIPANSTRSGYAATHAHLSQKDGEVIDLILEADTTDMIDKILAPFRMMDERDLRNMIHNKAGKNSVGRWLRDQEFFVDWTVAVIRDEKALPMLAGILKERNHWIMFMVLNFVIILMSIMLKRSIRKKELGIRYNIYAMVTTLNLELILFTFFFRDNFSPIVKLTWNALVG